MQEWHSIDTSKRKNHSITYAIEFQKGYFPPGNILLGTKKNMFIRMVIVL